MNAAILWRIVWKEYRQQRALWFAIAAGGVLMQLSVLLLSILNHVDGLADRLFTVALSVPVLYSLGCGASLFAGEHEAETFPFQQSLPVSAFRVFAGKFLFAVASALALFPVLWLVAWVFSNWHLPANSWHQMLWAGGCIAAIEVLIWASLASLVIRRVLPAAVVSGLVAVFLGYSALVLAVAFGDFFEQEVDEYFSTLPLRSLCALIALAVTVDRGRRWFDENPAKLWGSRAATESTAKKKARVTKANHLTIVGRLVWQQWRQSRVTMFCLVAAYFLLYVAMSDVFETNTSPEWLVIFTLLGLLATALGACTFWSDHQRQQYHFFTDHGVHGRLIWLSRQVAWGSLLVIVGAISCLPLLSGWPEQAELPRIGIGLAVVMFASAQACSLFIRSGIVAFAVAVFCSILLFVSTAFLDRIGIWWVVSTLPLPLIFWWATWLYAPKLIQQRKSWRVRLATAASISVPLAVVVGGTFANRVYEVPAIQTSFDTTTLANADLSDPKGRKTAEMYFEANTLLRRRIDDPQDGVTKILLRDADWDRGIDLFVAASHRPNCRFFTWDDSTGMLFDGSHVTNAAIAEARQRLADGDLEGARELYESLLRLAAHGSQQRAAYSYSFYTRAIEAAVWEELPTWAAQPGQDREDVLDMLKHVREHSQQNNHDWELATLDQHHLVQRIVAFDDELLSKMYTAEPTQMRLAKVLAWLMPWERARVLRLLDIYTEARLQEVAREATLGPARLWPPNFESGSETTLTRRDGERVVVSEDELLLWARTTPWFPFVMPFDQSYRGVNDRAEMLRSAVQIQLALIAWRMEHDELPDYLEQLIGDQLEMLPVDPYTGQPFVYIPDGVDQEISVPMDEAEIEAIGDDIGMAGMAPSKTKIVRTDSFIWSPAEDLYFSPETKRGPTGSPQAREFRTADGKRLASDEELLHDGVRFFIPQEETSSR